MTDSLIEMYDRGFERDTMVAISVTRGHWLKISDRITQLRQELSLAEEGLANYAQENERLKAELHRMRNDVAEWVMMCKCGCPACMALLESFRDAIPQSEPNSG